MIRAVIFDLDGTLFLGRQAIPGAAEKLRALKKSGIGTLFLTNAATRTRAGVAEKLQGMELPAGKEEIYCSSYLIAKYIQKNHAGKTAFVIGESGLFDELHGAGIVTVEKDADIVVVGLDRKFTYRKLANGLSELEKGAVLIASNGDGVYPTDNGYRPGAGAILASVEAACGKKGYVVGKPNPFGFEIMKQEKKLAKNDTLMVGDRLDTDILFAKNCGIRSALVLTGVAKKEDIGKIKPDFVLDSIGELSLP